MDTTVTGQIRCQAGLFTIVTNHYSEIGVGRRINQQKSEQTVRQVVAFLREQRIALGWSQRNLAANAGVDHATVSLIERGNRSPTLYTLCLLAGAMNVSLAGLIKAAEHLPAKPQ